MNTNNRYSRIALWVASAAVVIAIAVLTSCGGGSPTSPHTPPPVAQKSPQQVLADYNKLLADSANTTVRATISLRDSKKISQADTVVVQNWCLKIANASAAIAVELSSADPWPTQRTKIAFILAERALPSLSGVVDPTLQSALNATLSYLNMVYGGVQ